MARNPHQGERTGGPADVFRARPEVVLLSEDFQLAGLIRTILGDIGIDLIFTGSGCRTASCFGSMPPLPDVVILDLPFGVGYAETGAMVASLRKVFPGVGVLLISSYSGDEILPATALRERVRCLQKPFRTADLASAVREMGEPGLRRVQ